MKKFFISVLMLLCGTLQAQTLDKFWQLTLDGEPWFRYGSQADCDAGILANLKHPKVTAKGAAGAVFDCPLRIRLVPAVAPVVAQPLPAPAVVTQPATIAGRTFYVDAAAATDSGNGSASAPKKFIGSGMALLSTAGGDTLLIKPGTYGGSQNTIGDAGAGKPGAWNVIKAETDGTVVITADLGMSHRLNHYVQLEGLRFDSMRGKSINGGFVKVLRSGFRGGPLSDNTMNLSIGTNDVTPGAHDVLVEDSHVYGVGGRYSVLVYNSDRVVLRRVVVRHEPGWGDTKGDPEAGVSIYNSTDVLTQNMVIVDSFGGAAFAAGLYHPSNSRASANIRNVGAFVVNVGGNGVCWDDGATVRGMTLENSVIAQVTQVGACANGGDKEVQLKRVTIAGTGSHGVANWGSGAVSFVDSKMTDIGGDQFKNSVTSSGSSVGASITKRSGKSGTLYGDPGFDQDQTESIFPFPTEAAVIKSMCWDAKVTTGFCTKGLSAYLEGR